MATLDSIMGLLGIGGGGLLVGDAYNSLGDVGDDALTMTGELADDVYDKASFTGYGVTGPVASTGIDATGNLNTQLSPEQQQMMDHYVNATTNAINPFAPLGQSGYQALNYADQAAQNMLTPSADMEQEYYNKIRAMQTPEEARSRTALESRLAAQGRLGVSALGVGQPQQFGLEKAIQEAQNQAAVQAIELARQQQAMQQANYGLFGKQGLSALGLQGQLADTYGMLQYAPQAAALDQLQGANQAYQFADVGRRNAATLYGTANMSGLDAYLGANLGQANLMGGLGSSLIGGGTGLLGQIIAANGSLFG
jgi:hypothetical protein